MFYFLIFLLALVLAAIFTLIVKKIALRFNIVDSPDSKEGGRKIHDHPIPLLGGIAIFLAYFLVIFLFPGKFLSGNLHYSHLIGFFVGALIIMIGGALDDKYNLRPYQQIIFPLLAIAAVILGGVEISQITNPLGARFDHAGIGAGAGMRLGHHERRAHLAFDDRGDAPRVDDAPREFGSVLFQLEVELVVGAVIEFLCCRYPVAGHRRALRAKRRGDQNESQAQRWHSRINYFTIVHVW